MDEPAANHWTGKSTKHVLTKSLHQLRAPINTLMGSLHVLKSADQLSPEQTQQMMDLAWQSAVRMQEVIDAMSQYVFEKYNDQ